MLFFVVRRGNELIERKVKEMSEFRYLTLETCRRHFNDLCVLKGNVYCASLDYGLPYD